jgi:hypothetical protein
MLVDEPDGLYPWFRAEAVGCSDAETLAQAMLERAAGKYRYPSTRFRYTQGRLTLAAGITSLVLKAPNLTYDDGRLSRIPVPVTAVYPVRDPRSVVVSMARLSHVDFIRNQLRLLEECPETASQFEEERRTMADVAAPLWVRHATIWKVKSGLAPKFKRSGVAVHQFRYEDLVQEPHATAADLLNACDLPVGGENGRPEAAYLGYGPGGTDRTRPIDKASLLNWRSDLNKAQEVDILRVAGELAKKFGYG